MEDIKVKRQIRRNVFETNSSSMHSITITKGENEKSYLSIGDNNKVVVEFGEFGWQIEDYADQYSKLQYLVTMCAETEGRSCKSQEEFYETEGFKNISNAIALYCNCDGIEIPENSIDYSDGHLIFRGYIDHQSCEDYESLAQFLKENYVNSIEDFIFNEGIIVHTDNDNH